MEFLYDWGLFLVDAITIVIAILIVVGGIIALASKGKDKDKNKGSLSIKKMNKKFSDITTTINNETLSKSALKTYKKNLKKTQKEKSDHEKPRLFVIDFHGDIKASAVDELRQCVTAILLSSQKSDHVLLRLESPGGIVPGYGLAASQLQRLRDANIRLTVAVDKIAASGGYMMACIANDIIAAPFAIIGSIGVVYQLPNFNRLLRKKAIDFEQVTAGDYKRTLSMFGENTKQDRAKVQLEVDETQVLFKEHVSTHRQQVDIDRVATGEHWYGSQALDLKLVDTLQTSDDFILTKHTDCDIYQVQYRKKQKLGKKLAHSLSKLYSNLIQSTHHA